MHVPKDTESKMAEMRTVILLVLLLLTLCATTAAAIDITQSETLLNLQGKQTRRVREWCIVASTTVSASQHLTTPLYYYRFDHPNLCTVNIVASRR